MTKNMEIVYKTGMYTIFSNKAQNKYMTFNNHTQIIEDESIKLPTAIGGVLALERALAKVIKEISNNGKEDSIN